MPRTKNGYLFEMVNSVIELFYPRICSGCSGNLLQGEALICTNCVLDLSFTDHHIKKQNMVEERLAGKVRFEAASALCYYHKSSVIQQLVHELKYRDNTDVGLYLGEMLGRTLLSSHRFDDIDYVVPTPLHPSKLKKRGYNQSEFIAQGICDVIGADVFSENLIRTKDTKTQTKKSIFERWQNVSKIFQCSHPERFEGKHILLVDDVITSGSTLEGCINALTHIPGIKVSVGVIACAE